MLLTEKQYEEIENSARKDGEVLSEILKEKNARIASLQGCDSFKQERVELLVQVFNERKSYMERHGEIRFRKYVTL